MKTNIFNEPIELNKRIKIYGKKKPYKWQKEAHDYITGCLAREEKVAETIVIKAARQRYGKSAFTKAELIRFSLGIPHTLNAYVSPTMILARKMFKEVATATADFIASKNATDNIIVYKNGSQIRFHSEQQGEALRGFTVTGLLVLDEASSFKDNSYYELIAPWTTVHKALTIIISTPKFKIGFFYENYLEGRDEDNLYYTTFDWCYTYNIPIPPEDYAKKNKMPFMKWRSEYEGLFLNAEGAVFGDFSRCLIKAVEEPVKEIYLGLDFGTGTGKDYTVLTGIDEKGRQRFVWAVNDIQPTEQVKKIADIIRQFREEKVEINQLTRQENIKVTNKVKSFYAESNSIGKVYLNLLRDEGIAVNGFFTDSNSKRKLIEDMQVAIQNKEIGILEEPEQVKQLSFYESKVDKSTNKVTYNAPLGLHDDYVIAILLANKAYGMKKKNRYNIL